MYELLFVFLCFLASLIFYTVSLSLSPSSLPVCSAFAGLENLLFSVLRNVLRPERGDAQADGDCQAAQRNHCPASSLPLTGGMLLFQRYCINVL